MKREITCIGCPMGCLISAEVENGSILSMSGYTCPRGEIYAKQELTTPERAITTLIRCAGATPLSVKTASGVPKAKIPECLAAIHAAKVTLPVKEGQVVLHNVCGTGVDVVATRDISG